MGRDADDAILALVSGAIGAGLGYGSATPKIKNLEAQNTRQIQQINSLQYENQTLRNDNAVKANAIVQKDQILRQKDEQIAVRDAEINKLKQELKRFSNK